MTVAAKMDDMEPKLCATTRPQVVQRAGGSVMMAAACKPNVVMLAAIQGTLTRTDWGCLAISGGDTSEVTQFPFGTVLADDGQSVDVPDLGTVRIGDPISGGGGSWDIDSPGDLPDECVGITTILFLQAAGRRPSS